ncbi:MAG: NAD-dependent protein deacylase [Candidatus Bathyarchaeota archaeon]|nr:MAG: NAD-dependent protein deacylase [Candidatus Bathyarchaeota archaeon]
MEEEVSTAIKRAAQLVISSEYVTVLTGAGVSVESGVRPFRGPGGLWTERGEPSMDGYQSFMQDPKAYWERRHRPRRYRGSWTPISEAAPNPGHLALAELEGLGLLKWLVTQNIDNLHNEAGSRNVLEIHGNSKKLRCVSCDARYPREGFDLSELPPRCPVCGGFMKGDTVMFGEPIPSDVLERCFEESNRSDCMLVVGTSAVVTPAASLPLIVKRNGGVLIEVNPFKTELSNSCDVCIRAPSGKALPRLVSAIKELRG